MKKISVLAAVFLILGVAATAMAGPRGMGHWGGSMELRMLDSVNLTPEQSEKILALKKDYFTDVHPLRSEMFSKRAELRLLWLQTTPDAAKINATQDAIWELRKKMQEKRTDFRLNLRKILTPEQVTQILSKGCGGGPGSGYRRGSENGFGKGGSQGRGRGDCWR